MENNLNNLNNLSNLSNLNNLNEKYELFWMKLINWWPYIYNRLIENSSESQTNIKIIILKKINSFLENIKLDISFTYGEINNINLSQYSNIIEIYISPIMDKNNIEEMENLYNVYNKYKNHLPNLIVSKYRIFNKNNIKIHYMDYTNIFLSSSNLNNINYPNIIYFDDEFSLETKNNLETKNTKYIFNQDEILYSQTIGKGNINNIILHLVIVFKKNINEFFEKKKIIFENSERDVWICKNNSIDILLENFIGEENLINYIGYIEFIPFEECSKDIEYKYITELINDIEFVRKNNNINYCNVCNHSSNQLKLSKCSRCKKILYCNKICQKIDYNNHKSICL